MAAAPSASAQSSSYEELQRFSAVLNHIRGNYPDSVGHASLVRAAIDGMLRSLDPHSWFASAADYERFNALERGELAVTGMVIEFADGVPIVLTYLPRSPAEKAGVLPGDRLLRIDAVPVAGLTRKSIELRLAGRRTPRSRSRWSAAPGSSPTPSASRSSARSSKRDRSRPSGWSIAQTGYVRLEQFGPDAADQVAKAIRQLKSSKAKQVVLDLRGNPGGLVTEAVDLAAMFLPGNTLVLTTRGRKKVVNEDYRTKGSGDFVDLPLVVLIDHGSASASEALAGALQDHDRALIVGRRSFGKALMQTAFFVPSGVVQLTVGRVYTPSGRSIQRRYQGFAVEQYYAMAGGAGEEDDTAKVYKTGRGREVRGGGGIAPDLVVPEAAATPAWYSVAADSGYDDAVADSVAATLAADPAGREAWMGDATQWEARLLPPLLSRVQTRLGVKSRPDSATSARLARRLAARAAFVRWPPDGGAELQLRHDPDVGAAVAAFPRLGTLLGSQAGR